MPTTAKSIFVNGRIFTANPEQPYASAMVVSEGRIEWIGEQAEIAGAEGARVDLQGRRVLPGLIDAHMHPLLLADAAKQIACLFPTVHSIADLQEEIRSLRDRQGPDAWIRGWGYDEGKLAEGRAPARGDLDLAAADAPVIVTRTCGHIAAANSSALALAGITRDTPDPPGGKIDRDEHGELTGVLRESAKDLLQKVLPVQTLEEQAALLAELSPRLLAHGITAITELMARTAPVDSQTLYETARQRGLKQRAVLYYLWGDLEKQPVFNAERTNRNHPIHAGGVKLFADGSVSGQTAWVDPPFLGGGENYGIATTTEQELLQAAAYAERHQVQLVVHAMGEQAIDLILDTFSGKQDWLADAPSIRIEHAAMPTSLAIRRAAEMGIAFVPQPIFLYAEIESYLNNLGAERTRTTYPVKTMLEAGIQVAFSSDAPATAWADPANPFVGLKAAVTREAHNGTDTGQEQRVDVATAVQLYTRAAQEITRIPEVGQLRPGYHADFIVLSQDILEISPDKIDETRVEATYMAGQLVYQREAVGEN